MRYYQLYADEAGESHWRDVDVVLEERSFAPPAKGILVSSAEDAAATLFLKLPPGWNEPAHPTPKRQYLVCLAGHVLATASDGETRDIKPGVVWLMDDVTGKGHHSRVAGDDDFDALIVQCG